jgi:hypothetical protein
LRNLTIIALRLSGETSIAAALRLPHPLAHLAAAADYELLAEALGGTVAVISPGATARDFDGSGTIRKISNH